MGLLTSTLTNYKRATFGQYNVCEYTSIDIQAVQQYITTLPKDMYTWYHAQDNDRFDRISLELYGNPDYWDVILILNHRHTLSGLPFDFDTVLTRSNDYILEYELFVYGSSIPDKPRTAMMNKLNSDNDILNESNRTIKVLKPTKMNKFLQDGYDLGLF